MVLSVIIVNYNVKFFLEQCLYAVLKAIHSIDSEIFVVDNNSYDGSCSLVREKFPTVKLIENKKNYGFAFANNQAIKQAKGKYILLLNPDTVVEEKTFDVLLDFMNKHPDAGCVGVKMIDGKGKFLPESKRALPTPVVAFYKIFGLSKLFPKSKTFGKYHLTYLEENKIHEVEVLAGAFMFLRKEALDKTGLLDEAFFMYGEDIDLSYRIIQNGYKNYYNPDTTIIHYKGESTKKGSLNYVLVFYHAMLIFAKKHFSSKQIKPFIGFIKFAIFFRASLAILKRILQNVILPAISAFILYIGFFLFIPIWEKYKSGQNNYFPEHLLHILIPVYIFLWIISIWITEGYKRPLKLKNLYKGIFIGTIAILCFYSLLSENMRFSRALIIIGTFWAVLSLSIIYIIVNSFFSDKKKYLKHKCILLLASENERIRIEKLLAQIEINFKIVYFGEFEKNGNAFFFEGLIEKIKDNIKNNSVNEIIFSAKSILSEDIIKLMLHLSDQTVSFKIAPPESLSIIGSNSIHVAGDFYTIDVNAISNQRNKQIKRVTDFVFVIIFLTASPLLIFIFKHKKQFISNCLNVFCGKNSFVGYYTSNQIQNLHLPVIKSGILNPSDIYKIPLNEDKLINLNTIYAKNYTVLNDIFIIFKALKKIDRKPQNIKNLNDVEN